MPALLHMPPGFRDGAAPAPAASHPRSGAGNVAREAAGSRGGIPALEDAARAGLVMAPGSPLEESVRFADAAAGRDCPVFLRGESGSGKELMARFLHRRGPRAPRPFVPVNCAAIPPQLIESELFGHRKGAFTGALEDSPGSFRLAAGGTLFLDEVGDMPLEVQTRLLRALQEKAVRPVGERREIPVDFRLVCATHRDLRREVEAGRFREDLYYRVAVVEIRLPPLRERPGDILPLLRRFLAEQIGEPETEAALARLPAGLIALPWPGNVRELRNVAERYAVLREMGAGWEEAAWVSCGLPREKASGERGPSSGPTPSGGAGRIRNSRVSDGDILRALGASGYHRGRASLLLGITRRALQYRLARMEPVAGRADGQP
ncbi:MAG TPA: sigma-54 dependent transcriptional regulator [Fibrobacteria bacterium]|nr:sigma-54 dependent transcriptional regulator [Fibrobacteria bacterium]